MAVAISRAIGPVPVDVVMREKIESDLEITLNPVEFGADITDHAYVQPKKIILEARIGSLPPVAAWKSLVALQETRLPFTLVSGLDIHRNMLIKNLTAERDKDSSRILSFTAELWEVIIVSSAYVDMSSDNASTGQAGNLKSGTLTGDTQVKGAPTVGRGDGAVAPIDTPRDSSILNSILGG